MKKRGISNNIAAKHGNLDQTERENRPNSMTHHSRKGAIKLPVSHIRRKLEKRGRRFYRLRGFYKRIQPLKPITSADTSADTGIYGRL